VIPGDLDFAPTLDEAAVAVARARVRQLAVDVGLEREDVGRLALIASELGHNQLRHAFEGEMAVVAIERGGVKGVELWAVDRGGGIVDARAALLGEHHGGDSLGVGLAGAMRMADEMDIEVRLGAGTTIRARKFVRPPAHRSEVGIIVAPAAGEKVSGDGAALVRRGDLLVVAGIDGLGHGPDAHAAAAAAEEVVRATVGGPEAILSAMDQRLAGTRGAAASVITLDVGTRELEAAGVGNLTARICTARASSTLVGRAGTLGTPRGHGRIVVQRARLEPGEVLILFSDGLKRETTLTEALATLREPPIVMAQHLLDHYGRGHDDALVIALR
jgi:anti-sigma regulatory factor (Ser/Thr protein kinase)